MSIQSKPTSEPTSRPTESGTAHSKPSSPLATGDAQAAERAVQAIETIDSLTQEFSADDGLAELPYELPTTFLLSVVVPVFNEERTIRRVVDRLQQLPLPLQVIVVDDGSTDGTVAELTRLQSDYPDVVVAIQPTNQGKGSALRKGFGLATGTHVVVQDADLEYDPADIPRIVEPLARGEADVVYGSRFLMPTWQGSSWLHRAGNRVLTWLSNWMTGLRLTDMETCYKVFRRDLLDGMYLEQDRFGFEVELTAKLARRKVRIVERPIRYAARSWEEGKKIGLADAFQAIYCIAKYR